MVIETLTPLDYTVAPLGSLGLNTTRIGGAVVGRRQQFDVAEQQLAAASGGISGIVVEGEPGIGKTRFFLAIEELARAQQFLSVVVTADEEIRGPLLLARSIFASPAAAGALQGTPAEPDLRRVVDALNGKADPEMTGLPPDQRLMRIFDLAAMTLRALAAERPLAILVDDVQWADADSLRLLRYAVRTSLSSPIFLGFALRPEETAQVSEAITLLADMDRMGLLKRLKLARFSQVESAEFLQRVLNGRIDRASAATMHAQAEGVPFVLAEQVRAYREAGLIHEVDGVWTLVGNVERMLPSAVKTLIQRRSARLPEETAARLAEAAVLGRAFSLRDLRDVKTRLGDDAQEVESLTESLAPAVLAGLLVQHPDDSPADYSFTHENIREYTAATLTATRRRAIHAAVVEMLTSGGDASRGCLAMLAKHARAAGQMELCARVSIDAARTAIEGNAPEETLRLVEIAHPIASTPQDRIALLSLRDDALNMLRRPTQRLQGLAELGALADALGDSHLELDVLLRRAAALRLSGDMEAAAELAQRVQSLAAERRDQAAELAACMELGQDLFRTELGEGYVQAATEADIDGAERAFARAATLAEELGDDPLLAAATRELGIMTLSRVRAGFVEAVRAGQIDQVMQQIAAGALIDDIVASLPLAPVIAEAETRLRAALEIYERIGDRRGATSTVIAMAYLKFAPSIHLSGSARRIEEIHRLMTRMKSLTKESERASAEAQMLYGTHVYSRAKIFPDVELEKGEQAYNAARTLGDPALEFVAAGGLALAHAELGSVDEADRWLGRAATTARESPTPWRSRQIEIWRGTVRGAAGDAAGMREHLERASELAAEHGRPAERCATLSLLADRASRLGVERTDEDLMSLAEQAANAARGLMQVLPGHPTWGAQSAAALARIAMARGAADAAATHGREALAELDAAMREDLLLDIVLPACEAILATATDTEAGAVRDRLRMLLSVVAHRIVEEDIRVRWFRSRTGRTLVRLAGPVATPPGSAATGAEAPVTAGQRVWLLQLLVEGRTNVEIAEALGIEQTALAQRLAELYVNIGVSPQSDAATAALTGRLG